MSRGVLVSGPAGVGRTRILAEAGRRLDGELIPIVPSLGSASRPFAPLVCPEHQTDPQDEVEAIDRLRDRMDRAREPVTLLVDDVHHLRPEVARVISTVVLEDGARLLASVASGTAIDPVVRYLRESGAVSAIKLAPLNREETYVLLRKVFDAEPPASILAQLWRASRGNVAVLADIIHHSHGAIRLGSSTVLSRRARGADLGRDRLAEVRATLSIDEQLGLELLALAEPAPHALFTGMVPAGVFDSLQERGIIASLPSGELSTGQLLHVRQPVLGEALRASLSAERNDDIHRRLVTGPFPAQPYGRLRSMSWAAEAGIELPATVFVSGSELANRMHDFLTAQLLATAALGSPAPTRADDAVRARALHARAYAARFDGSSEQALIDLHEASRILRGVHPTAEHVELWTAAVTAEAAALHYGLGELDAALAVIDEARSHVTEASSSTPATSNSARVSTESASVNARMRLAGLRLDAERLAHLAYGGRFRAYLDDLTSVPRLPRSTAVRLDPTTALSRAAAGEPAKAVRSLKFAYARQSNSSSRPAWALEEISAAMFVCLLQSQGPAGVRAHIDTIDIDGSNHFVQFADGITMLAIANFHVLRGDLKRGLPAVGAAVSALEEHDPSGFLARAYSLQAEASALAGNLTAATEFRDRAHSEPQCTAASLGPETASSDSFVTAVLHGTDVALTEIHVAAAQARRDDLPGAEAIILQNAIRFNDPTGVSRVLELSDRLDGEVHRVFVDYARALRDDNAHQLLRVSLAFEQLELLVHSLETTHAAVRSAERQGMAKLESEAGRRAELLQPSLAQIRTPMLPTRSTHPELSPRGREIAVLVARGATNRDIAELLHLSVRTVEGHLGRVYTKLGITGRQELALIRGLSADPAPLPRSGLHSTQ